MAETAPAPTAENATKKKQPKKAAASKSRPVNSGPSVSELLVKAVSASKERSGMSVVAMKKSLAATGYDVDKNNSRVKIALKSLVSKGTLTQVKGIGASGSFKLSKKETEGKAKVVKKKVPAAKPKKPAPKKVAKSPKKPKKAPASVKSPKKKSAPAAKKAKSPKKPKAVKPKKATKSPAKKTTKAKPAKSPAKAKAVKSKKTAKK